MRRAMRPVTSSSGDSPHDDSPAVGRESAAVSGAGFGRASLGCPGRRRRVRWRERLPRLTRGRALTVLGVSLVVLAGGAFAAAAVDRPTAIAPAGAGQPASSASADPCLIAPPEVCTSPPLTMTTAPSRPGAPGETPTTSPPVSSGPCSGEGCIPQPGATTAPPTDSDEVPADGGEVEDECGITDIGACITEALDAFFRDIVIAALNPLLDLLSRTLLTTPLPEDLPQLGDLWNSSWEILLVSYGLLILIAGAIVMAYHTLQTRHSIKEIAPRIVVGFLAGGLSMWVATKAIQIANALAQAVMNGGVDNTDPMVVPGGALKDLIIGALTGGIWIIFLGIALAGMLVALLVTYIVRVALTFAVIAGAPIALMFHALPQTEGIGYWWWRVLGGCLAIQVIQSMALITMMRLFFAPGGFTMFGPNVDGLVNLLVAIALIYILFRIPGWILGAAHVGGGRRSMIGTLARGFVLYRAFRHFGGVAQAGGRGARRHGGGVQGGGPRPAGGGPGGGPGPGGHPGGGAHPRGRGRGRMRRNLRVHLGAAHRQQAPPFPGAPHAGTAATPRPARGTGRPENTPVLESDEQHQRPLDVQPIPPTPAAAGDASTGGRHGGHGSRGTEGELPFDPYKGNRASRGGQYPLPLEGVRRTLAPKPSPPPTAPPRPAPRAGQQLRLPLDLPKPSKPPTTPAFSSPPSPPPSPRRPKPQPGGRT